MGLSQSNQPTTRLNDIHTTESILGTMIPIIIGQQRLSWKLIWFGNFHSSKAKQQGGSGLGKGGVQYVYSASVIGAVCMGPCTNFLGVWDQNGKFAMQSTTESATLPGSGAITYTPLQQDGFKHDLGVNLTNVAYSVTVNDYGSPGSTTYSGTQNVPLVYTTSPTPAAGQYTVINTPNIGPFSGTSIIVSGNSFTINGSFTGGAANAFANFQFSVSGSNFPINNGQFTCSASTATTLTLNAATPSGQPIVPIADPSATIVIKAVTGIPQYVFNAAQASATISVYYVAYFWYVIENELDIVPNTPPYEVVVQFEANQPLYDLGVTYYPSGVAFTAVGGTPTIAGTYNPSGGGSVGQYTFAAADAGQGITINYEYKNPNTDQNAPNTLNFTFFGGGLGQEPWSFMTSNNAAAALGYSEVAYVGSAGLYLGYSPVLPQYNFEIAGPYVFGGGIPDANPADAILGLLTEPTYKLNFPEVSIGSSLNTGNSSARNMWTANNFFISEVIDSQTPLMSIISKWCEAGQCFMSWDEGLLKFIPLYDTTAVANGTTYIPLNSSVGGSGPIQPIIDLDDNDFVIKLGGNEDPIVVEQAPWQNRWNRIQVRWNVRTNDYNDDILQVQDEASVQQYGLMMESPQDWSFITTQNAAQFAANMRLQRYSAIYTKYSFTLKSNFAFLSPGDIVTITDGLLGTSGTMFGRTPCRIVKMTDDPKKGIIIEAENFPWSVGASLLQNKQAQIPSNTNDGPQAYPGDTVPVIFEVPNRAQKWDGDQIYIFANGPDSNWGGFQLWVSYNGTDYNFYGQYSIQGRLGTVQGVLGGLSTITVPATTYPWNPSDTFYPYSYDSGATSPILVPCIPGQSISFAWVSGLITGSSSRGTVTTQCGPTGGPGNTSGNLFVSPGDHVTFPSLQYCCVAAFVNSSGDVLGVFNILNTSVASPIAPAGTVNISIGVNNYEVWGNGLGSWVIEYGNFFPSYPYVQGELPVLDTTDTLTVQMNSSSATLQSVTAADRDAFVTLSALVSTGGVYSPLQLATVGTAPSSTASSVGPKLAGQGINTGAGLGAIGIFLTSSVVCWFWNQNGSNAGIWQPTGDPSFPVSTGSALATYTGNSILFNPPQYNGVTDPNVEPIEMAVLDTSGNITGYAVPWSGANQRWCMAVIFTVLIPVGGQYTIQINHDDGVFFGVNNGATRVSGPNSFVFHSNTAVNSYPVLGGVDTNGQEGIPGYNDVYVINCPTGGSYSFELDYFQWENEQNLCLYFSNGGSLQTPYEAPCLWLNADNVTGAGGYATVTVSTTASGPQPNYLSQNLDCTKFGFNVPVTGGGLIVGLQVTFNSYVSSFSPATSANVVLFKALLVYKGSVLGGQIVAWEGAYPVFPTSSTPYTLGSNASLSQWGLTIGALTPAIVNDPSFGVRIVTHVVLPTSTVITDTVDVNDVKIQIFLNQAGAGSGWSTPQDVNSATSYATSTLSTSTSTQWLDATGFGFNMPFGFILSGVEVIVNAFNTNSANISALQVCLLLEGIRLPPTTLNPPGQQLGTTSTSTDYEFGGPGDLWGYTTPAADGALESLLDVDNINDPTFGVALQMSGVIGDTMNLNNVRVILYGTSSYNLELISYEYATLIGENTYAITSIQRGVYGSYPCIHPPGSVFARLDEATLIYTVDPTYHGSQIYFKFLSFNSYGNQLQPLSAVVPYSLAIGGLAPGAIDADTGALRTGTPNYTIPQTESVLAVAHGTYGIQNIPAGYGLIGPQNLLAGAPNWIPVITGGGGNGSVFNLYVILAAGSLTAAPWDDVICNTTTASFGVTFPTAASSANTAIAVQKNSTDFNTVTILPAVGDTIQMKPSLTLLAFGDSVYLVSDGVSNWVVIAGFLGGSGVTYTTVGVPATTRGPFTIAHGLSVMPNDVEVKMTAPGLIRFQSSPSPPWDATYVYLVASDDNLTALLVLQT